MSSAKKQFLVRAWEIADDTNLPFLFLPSFICPSKEQKDIGLG
jgi:hypothetical protein